MLITVQGRKRYAYTFQDYCIQAGYILRLCTYISSISWLWGFKNYLFKWGEKKKFCTYSHSFKTKKNSKLHPLCYHIRSYWHNTSTNKAGAFRHYINIASWAKWVIGNTNSLKFWMDRSGGREIHTLTMVFWSRKQQDSGFACSK